MNTFNAYLQHKILMDMACVSFSALINDLIPMTRRFPKHVTQAMTHTNTRRTLLAKRSSKDEIPSVSGVHIRTWSA